MPEHRVGTQAESTAARTELIKKEKELTHRGDELTTSARRLPWVPVEKDYSSRPRRDQVAGRALRRALAADDLPLHVRPAYEAGCTVCSSIADNINANAPHLDKGTS